MTRTYIGDIYVGDIHVGDMYLCICISILPTYTSLTYVSDIYVHIYKYTEYR